MTFEEILPAVKAGGRARRAIWGGPWLELARPSLPDGRPLMPQLVIAYPGDDGVVRPFAGANWDLLADDWALLGAAS